MATQRATVGRIVHYTLTAGDLDESHKYLAGEVRPAVVVKVWPNEFGDEPGYNILVMTDEANDGLPPTLRRTSIELVDVPAPGKCHWPPRA